MRKTLYILALALLLVVYGTSLVPSTTQIVPNINQVANKVPSFSGPNSHSADHYARFAEVLKKYNTTTAVVRKGNRRVAAQPLVASVLPMAPAILPVFNKADILPKHQLLANKALTSLPERCHGALENFYVRYDNPKSRGLAGPTTMVLDGGVPDDEFYALFMHEIGHVFDLNQDPGCLGGTITSGISEFKDGVVPMYNDDPSVQFYRISWLDAESIKQGVRAADFVSGYASTNVFEDFAESHTLFVTNNPAFRSMALTNTMLALKYNFFITYMYPQGIYVTQGQYTPESKRPWDTTKLPFTVL